MTSTLIPSLKELNLSGGKGEDDAGLVDITNEFFDITSKIKYSQIIKSNNFSLLQGTHALELLNPRLDTYLMEKVRFSITDTKLNLSSTCAVVANQLKALTCWLGQNVSLPNSILSCEYIAQILKSYSETNDLTNILNSASGDVWKQVVMKFSILLICCVRLILNLALKSQIYEEEDLNTSTMNLNWLFDLSSNDIVKLTLISNKVWAEIENEIDAKDENSSKYLEFIKVSFSVLQTILSLESIYQWNIPLFHISSSSDFIAKFNSKINQLEKVTERLDTIALLDMDSVQVPENCFTLNAQIEFDNQAPPKELQVLTSDWNDCILNLNELFNDTIDILKILKSNNTIEFSEWLKYLETKRNNNSPNEITGLHIVSRIVFFSFINNTESNNEESVFNMKNFKFKDFFWMYLKEFSLKDSKIDNELKLSAISKLRPRNVNLNVVEQLNFYIETIALLWKEVLFLPTLNPSRQRQFKCKELKYWDLRQSETGNLEDYFRSLDFYKSNEKYYPFTFTIIYFKLKTILEIILKSIELNLFKDVRDYLSVYYQLTLISYQLDHQIDNLIAIVKQNNNSNNNYSLTYLAFLKNENNLIYQLAILKSKQFEILTFVGFNQLPKNLIRVKGINEELLFNLQWKQFNTITDPEMMNFKDFKERVKEFKTTFKSIPDFESVLNGEAHEINTSFTKSLNMCNVLITKMKWFDELKNIKMLGFEKLKDELTKSQTDLTNMMKLVKEHKDDHEFTWTHAVQIVQLGRHRYFPGVRVNSTQK